MGPGIRDRAEAGRLGSGRKKPPELWIRLLSHSGSMMQVLHTFNAMSSLICQSAIIIKHLSSLITLMFVLI